MPPVLPFYVRALRSPFDADRVRAVREGVIQKVLAEGLPASLAWDLAAACDELLCNLEEHGGAGWMQVSLEREERDGPLILRIRDDGREFDLKQAVASAGAPPHARERGLGLWMVGQLTRSLERRRHGDGENETILEF